MALKITNNALSTLAAGIAAGDLSLTLAAGDGAKFPVLAAGDWHPVTVIKSDGTLEVMKATARAGDVLTVARAQDGTTALAFAAGTLVQLRWTAGAVADVYSNIAAANTNANGRVSKGGDTMTGQLINQESIQLAKGLVGDAAAPMVYNDNATRNVVFRTGPSTAYKYSTIDANGRITAAGDMFSSGRVYATANGFMETTGNIWGTAFGSQWITDWMYGSGTILKARSLMKTDGGQTWWAFAGQGGQPTWLWGGNDGVNMYVWNPANFSVNYANSSNYANSAGGANYATSAGGADHLTSGGHTFYDIWDGVNGNINFYIDGSFQAYIHAGTSDERLKKNVVEVDRDALAQINKIKFFSFDWKADDRHEDFGFVAQQLQTVDPRYVYQPPGDPMDPNVAPLALQEANMLRDALRSIQQLSADVENLKAQLAATA